MRIETGNVDTRIDSGGWWFIGERVANQESLRHTDSCEVKWVRHAKGTKKSSGDNVPPTTRTLVVLISGKWGFHFPRARRHVVLEKPGDYLVYEGAAAHDNEAIVDSHLMVIRWW